MFNCKFTFSFLLLCSIVFIFTTDSFCQKADNKVELIIQTTELQPFRVYSINKQLTAITGVYFNGYLSKSGVLLISYDAAKIEDTEIITTAICHLNKTAQVEIISCSTFYSMIDWDQQLASLDEMHKNYLKNDFQTNHNKPDGNGYSIRFPIELDH